SPAPRSHSQDRQGTDRKPDRFQELKVQHFAQLIPEPSAQSEFPVAADRTRARWARDRAPVRNPDRVRTPAPVPWQRKAELKQAPLAPPFSPVKLVPVRSVTRKMAFPVPLQTAQRSLRVPRKSRTPEFRPPPWVLPRFRTRRQPARLRQERFQAPRRSRILRSILPEFRIQCWTLQPWPERSCPIRPAGFLPASKPIHRTSPLRERLQPPP